MYAVIYKFSSFVVHFALTKTGHHCRGVTRSGNGGTTSWRWINGGSESLRGTPKSPYNDAGTFSNNTFACERLKVWTWERLTCFSLLPCITASALFMWTAQSRHQSFPISSHIFVSRSKAHYLKKLQKAREKPSWSVIKHPNLSFQRDIFAQLLVKICFRICSVSRNRVRFVAIVCGAKRITFKDD